MPSINISVPHELGQETALERIQGVADKVREKYKDQVKNMEESWEGNQLTFSFRTLGFDIKGVLQVLDSEVKLDSDLPFAAMMFKGKIEESVREEFTKLLA